MPLFQLLHELPCKIFQRFNLYLINKPVALVTNVKICYKSLTIYIRTSGVTSLGENPLPPVVKIRFNDKLSDHSINFCFILEKNLSRIFHENYFLNRFKFTLISFLLSGTTKYSATL
jgi:hypothetical protein